MNGVLVTLDERDWLLDRVATPMGDAMIERTKGEVLLWADLPPEQRAGDGDPDALVAIVLALRGRHMPADQERCQAASQGNTTAMGPIARRLVKLGRFFRCVQRKKRAFLDPSMVVVGRFCHRHQAISLRGAAAVRRSAKARTGALPAGAVERGGGGHEGAEKGQGGLGAGRGRP